jgi:hypothetical protein
MTLLLVVVAPTATKDPLLPKTAEFHVVLAGVIVRNVQVTASGEVITLFAEVVADTAT